MRVATRDERGEVCGRADGKCAFHRTEYKSNLLVRRATLPRPRDPRPQPLGHRTQSLNPLRQLLARKACTAVRVVEGRDGRQRAPQPAYITLEEVGDDMLW